MSNRPIFLFLVVSLFVYKAWAVSVPQKHIPSPVVLELQMLTNQFDQALAADCAAELCISQGCVYRDHAVVDMPRSTSLPGISDEQGPGSVPTQEYLTEATCEFAHEKNLPMRDILAFKKRLEQRLSRGFLRVRVDHQILEPVPQSLSESLSAKEPTKELGSLESNFWNPDVAKREFWLSLLPHFSWMIALMMVTVAALIIIWALRRLGLESLEEKALAAQLAANGFENNNGSHELPDAVTNQNQLNAAGELGNPEIVDDPDADFINKEKQLWRDRIAEAQLTADKGIFVELLRHWLHAGDFNLLAKAVHVFGDPLTLAFPSNGEFAVRKVQFAEYLRTLDEKKLPSDAEFFRKLSHQAIASSLLCQTDAKMYRSIREEIGSTGIAELVEKLPERYGAILFALVQPEGQREVARILSQKMRTSLAYQLLLSNRLSAIEQNDIFHALEAVRKGQSIPKQIQSGMLDQGTQFDAAGALSVLLTYIQPSDRQSLFRHVLERTGGVFPSWFQDILYPDMFLGIAEELLTNILLEVNVMGLAAWVTVQEPAWQANFMKKLSPSLQNAIRANMTFESRPEQLRFAELGQQELVGALKKLAVSGRVSYAEMIV